jgi:AbrB family looped-hinge helix DNA binding protein
MKITSKGQVTIPVEIRKKFGFLAETEVEFEVEGDAVRIKKAEGSQAGDRGQKLVEHLKGRGDVDMSTDEIMELTRGEK